MPNFQSLLCNVLALCATFTSLAAVADPPTFRIAQMYSNLDGTTQFIRLTETQGLNGQHHFAGLTLTSTHNGLVKQFVFPTDLPTDQTAHLSIVVASSARGSLPALVPAYPGSTNYFWDHDFLPDFVIPTRFVPTDGGSVDFAGVDKITFENLPTDGENALNRDLTIGAAVVAPYYCIVVGRPTSEVCGSFSILPLPISVVEYYSAALDHYFYSASAPDIDALDIGQFIGWQRTGNSFRVSASSNTPVCRYYIPPPYGDSHFFSASAQECKDVHARFPAFKLETEAAFYVGSPYNADEGLCESPWDYGGFVPVYRLWNRRADTNHRYTTDKAVRDAMIAQGYVAEGDGPDAIAFCALP